MYRQLPVLFSQKPLNCVVVNGYQLTVCANIHNYPEIILDMLATVDIRRTTYIPGNLLLT